MTITPSYCDCAKREWPYPGRYAKVCDWLLDNDIHPCLVPHGSRILVKDGPQPVVELGALATFPVDIPPWMRRLLDSGVVDLRLWMDHDRGSARVIASLSIESTVDERLCQTKGYTSPGVDIRVEYTTGDDTTALNLLESAAADIRRQILEAG